MLTIHNKSITIFIIGCSLMICSTAKAYDASVSDFEWIYPQTLTINTSEIQYSYHFQMSPHSYPFECSYDTQLYLSRDRTLSSDDFALFSPSETDLPAGATGFTATTTNYFYSDISLPANGTYYIFFEITPGQSAPLDTDSTNNLDMAPNPIQVGVAEVPDVPGLTKELIVATVVAAPHTGQSMVIAGYTDGTLEFCDWQGSILASRDVLGNLNALHIGILGSPALPRLFVASTGSSGVLRVVDPVDINRDIVSRSNLSNVRAIEVCNNDTDKVYIGTSDAGGTVHKLNGLTLADERVRGGMGEISEIAQIHCSWGDLLVVGSDKFGGSIHFLDKDMLDDAITRRQDLGAIYGLCSADIDLDGEAELIVASGKDGGSIRVMEGPDFANDLAVQRQLGQIQALDYGRMEPEQVIGPTSDAWILVASESNGGSLRIFKADVGVSAITLNEWASLKNIGTVPYAELCDFYAVGVPLVGAVFADSALHVMDKSLTEPDIALSPSSEDFESGDFSKLPWEHVGNPHWTVTSQQKHAGTYSAKAGSINNNGSSTLQVTLDCVAGNITFYRKVSCESNFDYLKFDIDGVEKMKWSGEEDWAEVSFPVTAGRRIFKWTYKKDSSVSQNYDTAWIDDIVFPIMNGIQAGSSGEMRSHQSNSLGVFKQASVRTVINVEY